MVHPSNLRRRRLAGSFPFRWSGLLGFSRASDDMPERDEHFLPIDGYRYIRAIRQVVARQLGNVDLPGIDVELHIHLLFQVVGIDRDDYIEGLTRLDRSPTDRIPQRPAMVIIDRYPPRDFTHHAGDLYRAVGNLLILDLDQGFDGSPGGDRDRKLREDILRQPDLRDVGSRELVDSDLACIDMQHGVHHFCCHAFFELDLQVFCNAVRDRGMPYVWAYLATILDMDDDPSEPIADHFLDND